MASPAQNKMKRYLASKTPSPAGQKLKKYLASKTPSPGKKSPRSGELLENAPRRSSRFHELPRRAIRQSPPCSDTPSKLHSPKPSRIHELPRRAPYNGPGPGNLLFKGMGGQTMVATTNGFSFVPADDPAPSYQEPSQTSLLAGDEVIGDSQPVEDSLESLPQDTYDHGALADIENDSHKSADEETQVTFPVEPMDAVNDIDRVPDQGSEPLPIPAGGSLRAIEHIQLQDSWIRHLTEKLEEAHANVELERSHTQQVRLDWTAERTRRMALEHEVTQVQQLKSELAASQELVARILALAESSHQRAHTEH